VQQIIHPAIRVQFLWTTTCSTKTIEILGALKVREKKPGSLKRLTGGKDSCNAAFVSTVRESFLHLNSLWIIAYPLLEEAKAPLAMSFQHVKSAIRAKN
jgi:hypothetical protein